jgi:hypothetical protein
MNLRLQVEQELVVAKVRECWQHKELYLFIKLIIVFFATKRIVDKNIYYSRVYHEHFFEGVTNPYNTMPRNIQLCID